MLVAGVMWSILFDSMNCLSAADNKYNLKLNQRPNVPTSICNTSKKDVTILILMYDVKNTKLANI